MICRICASPSSPFGTARLLDRHDVQYFRCPACGFVQTEEPYWLDEAYAEAITRTDLGLVARNQGFSVLSRAVIGAFFQSEGRFLDYGGGYGLFVRTMRDLGFDFRLYERQCPNLFARRVRRRPRLGRPVRARDGARGVRTFRQAPGGDRSPAASSPTASFSRPPCCRRRPRLPVTGGITRSNTASTYRCFRQERSRRRPAASALIFIPTAGRSIF